MDKVNHNQKMKRQLKNSCEPEKRTDDSAITYINDKNGNPIPLFQRDRLFSCDSETEVTIFNVGVGEHRKNGKVVSRYLCVRKYNELKSDIVILLDNLCLEKRKELFKNIIPIISESVKDFCEEFPNRKISMSGKGKFISLIRPTLLMIAKNLEADINLTNGYYE